MYLVCRLLLENVPATTSISTLSLHDALPILQKKSVRLFARREMLDVVVVDGKARGITVRNLMTGAIERYAGDAVILATGGYGTAYFLSTNEIGRAHV